MQFVELSAAVLGLVLLGCASASLDGDWVFKGPDCPEAYSNCLPLRAQPEAITLYPYDPPPPGTIWAPWLTITCPGNEPMVILSAGELLFFEEGSASAQFTVDGRQYGPYSPFSENDQVIALYGPAAAEAVALLADAEANGEDVDVELRSYSESRRFSYAVAGFDRNYRRLPCSG